MSWRSWRIFRWTWPRNDLRRDGAVKAVRRRFAGWQTFNSSTTVDVFVAEDGSMRVRK